MATLVAMTLRGNPEAFATLVERYDRAVYHLAYRTLHDVEDAKDATQEAFFKAFRSLRTFKPGAKFSTWIFAIAYHACCDRLNRRKRYSNEELPDRADAGTRAGAASDIARRSAAAAFGDRLASREIPDGYHPLPPARPSIRGNRRGIEPSDGYGKDALVSREGAATQASRRR